MTEKMLQNPGRVPEGQPPHPGEEGRISPTNISRKYSRSRKRTSGKRRNELGIREAWLAVPVSGVKGANYYYSTYNAEDKSDGDDEPQEDNDFFGGGPNRIGQGIEFD
ncbi:carbamoyl-phosphate synthase, large subunit [Treponema saccharophilum DSM 2985]|uniref:Carbamoyl-phosphate synthase, large subunit n=1 Tax=Treponema saccharophilum DSM 2985 TaxID=907348 RepID=H7EPX7_9SPIR|nr:hypothetical protein [Treponema saccharophilum]EIC00364.1 carbamoyl-phosphate synthase, large subunit [Treponema saccharophilum DSM 2985]